MNVSICYRMHFGEDNKNRPSFYSKELCFESFINSYLCSNIEAVTCFNVYIDNSREEIQEESFLKKILAFQDKHFCDIKFLEGMGNSRSYLYCLEEIIKNVADDTIIFFVEDDYLWKAEAVEVLVKSFPLLKCDYLTPYDHPVRYDPNFEGGPDIQHWYNYIQICNGYHFRSQESTCMTFLSNVKVLKEDKNVHKHCTSEKKCPHDRDIFRTLQQLDNKDNLQILKKRLLLGPMPSLATHCHSMFLAPNVNWNNLAESFSLNDRDDRSI